MRGLKLVVGALATAHLSTALLVTQGSPCDQYCGNVLSGTAGDELTCSESSYSQSNGIVFEQCVNCELTSVYASGNKTDLQALLYNLRYALSWCLFGFPNNPSAGSNPCTTSFACQPLQDAIEWKNLSTPAGAYDFCQSWVSNSVSKCSTCLTSLDNGHFLNNFLTVIDAACTEQPPTGSTLNVQGSLFSTATVTVTTPTATLTGLPLPDYGPVSLGARVGIAFGALALILAITGFCIVMNGKRRRRAYLRELEKRHAGQGWPNPRGNGPDMFETPLSQKPLRGWDESPVSAHTEGTVTTLPRYFSPYSSHYNSPVSATEGGPSQQTWPVLMPERQVHYGDDGQQGPSSFTHTPWPTAEQQAMMQLAHDQHEQRQHEIAIGIALGGDEPSLRSKPSDTEMDYAYDGKGKNRDESYELQEVESPYGGSESGQRIPQDPNAPVLHHPGYGRQNSGSRPTTASPYGGLTEEDARRGAAL